MKYKAKLEFPEGYSTSRWGEGDQGLQQMEQHIVRILLVSFNFRLFRKGGGLQLQHLDVSGCKNITDKTLFKLSSSLGKLPVGSGISDIEDSSCDCHTLCSCGKLISVTPETAKRGLVYLGLSGCYQVTDAGLR